MEDLNFSNLYQVLESPDMFSSPEQLGEFLGSDYTSEDVYAVVDKKTFPTLQSFQEFFDMTITNPVGMEMDFTEQDRGASGVFDWFKATTEKLLGKDADSERDLDKKTKRTEELVDEAGMEIVDGEIFYKPSEAPDIMSMGPPESTKKKTDDLPPVSAVFDSNSDEALQNNLNTVVDGIGFTATESPLALKNYQDNYQKDLREAISKYGFLIEKPISYTTGMGSVKEFFDPSTISLDNLKKELEGKRETIATKNPDKYLTITSLDGNDQFNLNIVDPSDEELKLFSQFVNDKSRLPKEPQPGESNIAKALDVKESRTGKRFNLDTGDYSSVKMVSVEIDGDYYAMPTLFPKDPNIQSTYADRWIEYDPETQLDEIIEMANERGEKYAFNTKEEAETFAAGSWKDYNTVDLEKERFFQANGFEDYDGMMEAVNDYDAIRDEIMLINEIQGTSDSSQLGRRIARGLGASEKEIVTAQDGFILGDQTALDPETKVAVGYFDKYTGRMMEGDRPLGSTHPIIYAGEELTVDKKTVAQYPNLFNKDGTMRTDWKDRKVDLEKMRDNLYNITQDENFQEVSLKWDLEAAKRREAYSLDAVKTNRNANMGLKALDQYSIEMFGVTSKELENYRINNLENLNEQQLEVIDYIALAKGELDTQKVYAADQYIVSQTYLDSKSIKNAQGVVLEGFWPQVKNEWVTRGERGKAAELILAMSLFSEDPTKLQEINGMSREEVAKEVAKYLENSVTKSEGSSKEMLEWNKAKGWTESMDVFMDNPLDMAGSLAAGSPCKVIKENYYPQELNDKQKKKLIDGILNDWMELIKDKDFSNTSVVTDYKDNKIYLSVVVDGGSTVTIFDIDNRTIENGSGDIPEDLRDYLRRRGIKIYTEKPFKSIKPEWIK